MSFWDQSPGPTWTDFLKYISPFSKTVEPHILDFNLSQKMRPLMYPDGTRKIILTAENAEEIATLLKDHYNIFPKSRICITAARIRNGFAFDGWIGCGVKSSDNTLIACSISRSLGTLRIFEKDIPECGLVDLFCVAADWRKKGLASYLLQELVFETSKRDRLVHIFIKEGLPLSPLPPFWQSSYIVRKRGLPDPTNQIETVPFSEAIQQIPVLSNRRHRETGDSEILRYTKDRWVMYVCVTDTFHRTVPEAWRMGEVMWVYSAQNDMPSALVKQGVEAVINQCKYEILLMDSAWPHDTAAGWKKDTMYGWYIFNCHPGTFFGNKPYLTF